MQSGPSGATYGVIAALYVELLRFERRVGTNTWAVLGKMALSVVLLLLVGLCLPQVDNFSHLFGFLFGLLISYALRPHRSLCGLRLETTGLIVAGVVSGVIAIGLFLTFVLIFYVAPQVNCDGCVYFNCIPFSDTYCDSVTGNLTFV